MSRRTSAVPSAGAIALAGVAAMAALGRARRAGTSNTRFFSNITYDHQVLRVFNGVPAGGADTGEILEAIRPIRQGDEQSWYAAWNAAAQRASILAAATSDPRSKGLALLRAHSYLRAAEFLLQPQDPKRPSTFQRGLDAFYHGLSLLGVAHDIIQIPYGGFSLKAVYYPAPDGAYDRPLLIFHGGFDSTLEELYFHLAKDAHDRGYAVLTFEGPGQGSVLREQGLVFTPEWEKPTGAVLDAFLADHAKPTTMVLVGMSLGGYLAPRAAAFDRRIDGVVAFDVMYDAGEAARLSVPAIAEWLHEHGFNRMLRFLAGRRAAIDPSVRWAVANGQWVLGTDENNPIGVVHTLDSFTLEGVAGKISADVLLLAGAHDHPVPFSQVARLQRALTKARSVTTRVYDQGSGGAEHCQMGAVTLWHQDLFDWLTSTFPSRDPVL